MSKSKPPKIAPLTSALIISIAITIMVYVLRGLGILGFIPGSILLLLIAVSIILSIVYSIRPPRRL
ncbi:hypothetical protein [Aphanothece sacrum]|uniref:Uncharacterized protein n=1 Tax=Aphanothece sacrum FPU1 TaxID=1920663 RepID=A0A401IG42_APHSA|nr:hypothetical protein [Aphanothece sacrum]GBF80248.1 hypothetical protein AsFPU1_1649 [Aphanothece sacrum FPU1]GBF83653.1 hypothetical protein AsFPU3_0696 [Aphanothece sacrum FPU3]